MTVNAALLRSTLDYIKTHPEQWNQKTWHCGTTACFAGHAAILAGCRWGHLESSAVILTEALETLVPSWRIEDFGSYRVTSAAAAATVALGLTESQANALFASYNTLESLEEIVEALIDGADGESVWEYVPEY